MLADFSTPALVTEYAMSHQIPSGPSAADDSLHGRPTPRRSVPDLRVPLLNGFCWNIAEQTPRCFSMIAYYRGDHCPVCTTYMRELKRLIPEFDKRGISVVAISSDTRERAEMARDNRGLPGIPIDHDLPIATARRWGLYISADRGKSSSDVDEPAVFSEPGRFVVRHDQTLYWASYATMPFAWPHFNEMLQAFDFVEKSDYPARGEL